MNVTKRMTTSDDRPPTVLAHDAPKSDAQPEPPSGLSLPEPIKYAISILLVLLGVGIIVGLSFLRESNARVKSDALIPLVDVTKVNTFQGNLDLVLSGTVVPFREIQVGAQVTGKIAKKYPDCEAGTFVQKGTPLIQIDPLDYELEIETVNSEIVQAEKTILETEQDIRGAAKSLELANREFQLQQNEYQRKLKLKKSLAPTEMDQAKRNLLNSESQVTTRQNTYNSLLAKKESLKASLALNQTRLERAKVNLKRATVVAPVDGVIVRESVEEGSFVAVSNALFVIEDTSKSEVICNLTPGELAWLRRYAGDDTNQSNELGGVYDVPRVGVEIFEQNEPRIVWSGVLERFDGIGRNQTTKSIPCRIVVADPVCDVEGDDRRVLVRGMFVKCRAILSASKSLDLASIPLVAIRPGDYVWVVRDEKLTRIDVEVIDRSPIGSVDGTKMVAVKVANGLKLGDTVVTSPLPQPIEGGRVLLKDGAGKTSSQTDAAPANQSNEKQDSELTNYDSDESAKPDAERSAQ